MLTALKAQGARVERRGVFESQTGKHIERNCRDTCRGAGQGSAWKRRRSKPACKGRAFSPASRDLLHLEHVRRHRAQAVFLRTNRGPKINKGSLPPSRRLVHRCSCVANWPFSDLQGSRGSEPEVLCAAEPRHRRSIAIIDSSWRCSHLAQTFPHWSCSRRTERGAWPPGSICASTRAKLRAPTA